MADTRTPEPADAAGAVRVSKLMTERGLASRREADAWIEAGWVNVNGQPAVKKIFIHSYLDSFWVLLVRQKKSMK
jgi:hypothetical protein